MFSKTYIEVAFSQTTCPRWFKRFKNSHGGERGYRRYRINKNPPECQEEVHLLVNSCLKYKDEKDSYIPL